MSLDVANNLCRANRDADAEQGSKKHGQQHVHKQKEVFHDHAASADGKQGHLIRDVFAASRRCAIRDAGMPFRRQLWTVETGHWSIRATALVPPNPSMMRSASVCMGDNYDIRNFIASVNCGIRNG